MPTNPAFTGSVFDLSREPSGLRVAVTCSECNTRQVGGDKADCPIDIVSRHFSAKHWLITDKWRRATCPECQRKRSATKQASEPVDMSKVQAELDRQREAEECRQAASAKTAAEVFGAPAQPITQHHVNNATATSPTMTTVADKIQRTRDLISRVPDVVNKPGWRNWNAVPGITAECVAIYLGLDSFDRLRLVDAVSDLYPGYRQVIGRFAQGHHSAGGKPWGDLRVAMQAIGVQWTTEPPARVRSHFAVTPTTSTAAPTPTMPQETPAQTPKSEPSREARRAHAAAIRLLDLHFTVADGADVGHYADGWSDARVAKESGLSPAEVARTREDVYGRLEDPEEVARAAAIADLSTRFDSTIASLRRDLDDARRIVDALAKEVDERTAAFQREVAALKAGASK